MGLIHKHLIVTGHFETINPLLWPWPKLHDLNDDLLKSQLIEFAKENI